MISRRNSNTHLILSSSSLPSVMMCGGGDGIPHLTTAMMSERAHPSLPIHSSAMHHTHTRSDRQRQVCQPSACKYTALYYLRQITSVTFTKLIILKIRCFHVFGHVLLTFMKNRLYDSSNLNINLI